MFRRSRFERIKPGQTFRPRGDHLVAAIAMVTAVQEDVRGIPHVHFHLTTNAPCGAGVQRDHRILAIESFADLYPVAVQPAAMV